MRSKCETLLVRHLPSSLSEAEKVDLLKYFGADTVRCMRTAGKLRNAAFATFPTVDSAEAALARLHQTELLGSRLIVEYALEKQLDRHFPNKADQFPRTSADDAQASDQAAAPKDEYKSKMEAFAIKLHALSSEMGLDYILSPMLTYAYPPPSPSVVANIATLLLSVPKFYNQVLHLMNKMNLPAPFGPLLPQPPMMQQIYAMHPGLLTGEALPATAAAPEHESSLEESEMESDEEEDTSRTLQPSVVPQKRKSKAPVRRPKLQRLLPPHPAQEHAPKVSDVFEPVAEEKLAPKQIAINIRHEAGDEVKAEPAGEVVEEGGFGVLLAKPKPAESTEVDASEEDNYDWSGTEFLQREEVRSGRISSEEMSKASVFKNYEAGDIASRLYIKNVAKAATVEDLFQIYGGYIDTHSEQQRNAFDIRLMKEGRMKGQAFLTLANESQADRARRDTNGYLLKGRPLVVQFARSAKAKKPSAS